MIIIICITCTYLCIIILYYIAVYDDLLILHVRIDHQQQLYYKLLCIAYYYKNANAQKYTTGFLSDCLPNRIASVEEYYTVTVCVRIYSVRKYIRERLD